MSDKSIASWQCSNCGQWVNGGTHSCERLTNPLPPIQVARLSEAPPDLETFYRIAIALEKIAATNERIAAVLEAQSQKAT